MKRKRFLSILISLVMAASLVTPAFAAQTPTTLQTNVQGDNSRKNPIVTWPTAMITYGQVLTSQSFTGGFAKDKTNGEIISGTFIIDNLPADLLDANNDTNTHYSFTATFTPTDTSFYNTIQGTVIAIVNKAKAAINITGGTYTYDGQAHGATGTAIGINNEDLSSLLELGDTFTDYPGGTAQWTFTGNNNYKSDQGSVSININKADAAIKVAGGTYTYDGEPHGATGTATGVNHEDLNNLLTITGTFINVPGGTANWSFAGSNNYKSDSGSVDIVINKADAAITLSNLSQIYDGAAEEVTITTVPTGLNYDVTYKQGDVGVQSPINAGTYEVVVTINENNYKGTAQSQLVIDKAPSTTTVTAANAIYDGKQHGGTAFVAGAGGLSQSLPITYTGKTWDGIDYTSTAAPAEAGQYTATAAFEGDDNHYGSSGNEPFVINKAPAEINVVGGSYTYDGEPHGATGTATGVKDEDLSNLLTITGTFTDVPGGTANWSFAGNNNYQYAEGSVAININKANAKFDIPEVTCTYDGKPHGAAGTATGVKGEDLNNLLIITGSFIDVPGGTASWLFSGNNNYNSASGSAAIVINKADAEITLSNLTQTYDGDAKAVSVTTDPADLQYDITYKQGDTEVQSPINAGSYDVEATINENNYKGTVQGQLVIGKAPSITTVTAANAIYDGKQHGGTASVTGAGGFSQNLPIIYTGITSSGASYSSSAAPIEPGQYTATATFEGDDNHTGSHDSKNFAITYTWSGFLQPIDSDRSTAFKLGSTIPVKFSLTGTSANITNAAAKIYYAKVNNDTPDTDIEPISTSAATTGNLFRYDSTSGQYIFNLSTKNTATTPFTTGTYQIKIDLGDGVNRTINISLK